MPNIVSDSGEVQRKKVHICQSRDIWISDVLIRLPRSAIRMRQYRHGWNCTGRIKEEVGCLEYVQSVLEVVIGVGTTIYLPKVLEKGCNLSLNERKE